MAQRSARGRIALEKKISSQSGAPSSAAQIQASGSSLPSGAGIPESVDFGQFHGISKSTSFNPSTGLLTPSASSIATGSSGYSSTHFSRPTGSGAGGGRHGFPFISKAGVPGRKSALRAILEGQSDKIRGRLEDALRNKKSANHSSNAKGTHALGTGSKKLGDISDTRLLSIKRWEFNGKPGVAGWDKIQRDPELWFPDGDTLVYLCPQGHPSHQFSQPSFRVKSSVLKATESPFWNAILTDNKNLSFAPPPRTQPSPRHAPAPLTLDTVNLSNSGNSTNINRPPTPSTPGSPMSMTLDRQDSIERVASHASGSNASHKSSTANPGSSAEGVIYEIHFPAPVGLTREQVLKYHLTTRNVFAVLFDKSLVGVTLGEALLDLVERMDFYIPPTSQARLQHQLSSTALDGNRKRKNLAVDTDGMKGNVGRVLEYLLRREFDDFRNCPEIAAGVLCFAEKYQLGELWREAFCHCVGMLNQMEGGKEYMEISPITKALIDRASLEIQVRVGCADERLATFQFDDMWPTSSISWSPSRLAYEKFQKFLIKHYQSRFGAWPPPPQKSNEGGNGWGAFGLGGGNVGVPGAGFSRQIYLQLQRDFAALYDYLVDKDVVWSYPLGEPSTLPQIVGPGISTSTLGTTTGHGSSSPKNRPKLISPNKKYFKPDDDNLPMTDILIAFDEANGYPHIPHPYPLVPELKGVFRHGTNTGPIQAPVQQKHSFLPKRNSYLNTNASSLSPAASAAADKAAALALSESTNIHSLLSSKAGNELVDAFVKFEKERSNGEYTPSEGRKGRWLLIYGMLQTLATVAWDAQGLRYTDGVEYFLSVKLKGTPPWASGGAPVDDGPGGIDDHHRRSHCWTVVGSWDSARYSSAANDDQSLSPVMSSVSSVLSGRSAQSAQSAPPRTPGDMYHMSRSIGVVVGDATDTESGYQSHSRVLGGRKRKALPGMAKGTETAGASKAIQRMREKRGESMSGDEGDDEADDDDDDIIMGEARNPEDIPILEQEVELSAAGTKDPAA